MSSNNTLSDDTKWFIQITAVWITLIIVFMTFWKRQSGRSLDNVSINYKRWAAQHTFTRIKCDYTEYELLQLETNAENLRKAYTLLNSDGPVPCPWGADCPARTSNTSDKPEQHILEAYDATKKSIEEARLRRLKTATTPFAVPVAESTKIGNSVNDDPSKRLIVF